jgi:hypothetical protein
MARKSRLPRLVPTLASASVFLASVSLVSCSSQQIITAAEAQTIIDETSATISQDGYYIPENHLRSTYKLSSDVTVDSEASKASLVEVYDLVRVPFYFYYSYSAGSSVGSSSTASSEGYQCYSASSHYYVNSNSSATVIDSSLDDYAEVWDLSSRIVGLSEDYLSLASSYLAAISSGASSSSGAGTLSYVRAASSGEGNLTLVLSGSLAFSSSTATVDAEKSISYVATSFELDIDGGLVTSISIALSAVSSDSSVATSGGLSFSYVFLYE